MIAGMGQPAAGDDGVGLVVAARLRAAGVDARSVHDAADLIELLGVGEAVVLVDAVVGAGPVGTVRTLAPAALGGDVRAVSSHAMSVPAALRMAEALHGRLPRVDVVAVAIARPERFADGLSPPVAAAVPSAMALAWAMEGRHA